MANLNKDELKVFIEAVKHYFAHLTDKPVEIRTSYLADTEVPRFDYTGLITLSGRFRGSVYFSAPRLMIRELLIQLQEPDTREDNLLDAVGEVANTIAGNARRHFGNALDISVPTTLRGGSESIHCGTRVRPFAILLRWQRYDAVVVVDIEPAS